MIKRNKNPLVLSPTIKGNKQTKEVCTCGNPSKEGYVRFINEEDLEYICCDCHKQVLN